MVKRHLEPHTYIDLFLLLVFFFCSVESTPELFQTWSRSTSSSNKINYGSTSARNTTCFLLFDLWHIENKSHTATFWIGARYGQIKKWILQLCYILDRSLFSTLVPENCIGYFTQIASRFVTLSQYLLPQIYWIESFAPFCFHPDKRLNTSRKATAKHKERKKRGRSSLC